MKRARVLRGEEVVTKVVEDRRRAEEYVRATGLCHVCKRNCVALGNLKCQTCMDKTEEILKQLRGKPGFAELLF